MSIASFSPLEIQLVRASLTTKSTEEICELLERSFEDLTELINDITGGKAEEREADVKLYVQEKEKEKIKNKTGRPRKSTDAIEAEKKRKRELERVGTDRKNKHRESEKAWEVQRLSFRKRQEAKYKTRVIDYSKLITVKLDDKTWAQIEIQPTKAATDQLIKQTRATYEANKSLNKYKILGN